MTSQDQPNAPALPDAGGRLWLGRHPSLWLGTTAAGLSLGTALGIPGLSGPQVAAINFAVTAVVAAVWAFSVRPIAPPVFTAAVSAVAGVAAAYGFDVSSEVVGSVQAVLVQVITLIVWGQVSPAGAPVAVAAPAPPPVVIEGQATPLTSDGGTGSTAMTGVMRPPASGPTRPRTSPPPGNGAGRHTY